MCDSLQVKELGRAEQVLDLSEYERCEDVRKNKSRSKKNHSKFRLLRCSSPGNTVHLLHLIHLATPATSSAPEHTVAVSQFIVCIP